MTDGFRPDRHSQAAAGTLHTNQPYFSHPALIFSLTSLRQAGLKGQCHEIITQLKVSVPDL
jgi:hypothetical protein